MSSNARTLAVVLGFGCVIGGGLLTGTGQGGGVALLIAGLLIIASLVFERRYGRPNPIPPEAPSEWHPTGERFIDDETGRPLEVWMDPLTGERRYEPAGSDPRLRGPRP